MGPSSLIVVFMVPLSCSSLYERNPLSTVVRPRIVGMEVCIAECSEDPNPRSGGKLKKVAFITEVAVLRAIVASIMTTIKLTVIVVIPLIVRRRRRRS